MQFELKQNYDLWVFSVVPSPSSPPSIARARRPVADTTLVSLLFLFKETNSYLYDLHIYLYNFLSCMIVCYMYSAMVLISVPIGPRPVYDSDVVYYLLELFVSFLFMTINYADPLDIDIFI